MEGYLLVAFLCVLGQLPVSLAWQLTRVDGVEHTRIDPTLYQDVCLIQLSSPFTIGGRFGVELSFTNPGEDFRGLPSTGIEQLADVAVWLLGSKDGRDEADE